MFNGRLKAAVIAAAFMSMVGGGVAHASASAVVSSGGKCAGSVSWTQASRYEGRTVTIEAKVAGTKFASSSNGQPTFLNLGADYPDPSRVTVVIWGESRRAFGTPEVKYRGRTICIRGEVSSYGGVLEIEARSPSQIRVVK